VPSMGPVGAPNGPFGPLWPWLKNATLA
jgi:hypothetical protein